MCSMKRSMAVSSMLSLAQTAVDDLCLSSVAETTGFSIRRRTDMKSLIVCIFDVF